ncbi:hypothetical protein SCAR479_12531 [Seiridium cardinale]|uniref:RRM domain-containing protein n=1 Tax=Seiridium cardinale TaxID=138064 RepID=A0ABR2XAP3_9PEZI
MNQIRQIQTLNKRELEAGIYDPAASWHADYRDTAFVNFGGLPYNLSEGDVLTIFSQYGEPVFLKLARDKETGKSKGFGWLKYEDQRSCDLAVDNLGGAEISGRLIRVDHARYKSRDDEDETEFRVSWEDLKRKERQDRGEKSESETEEEEEQEVRRPMIKEERELAKLIAEHDEDDPMKAFLIDEKKKEVEEAMRREEKKEERHKHRHHHRSHRSRRDDNKAQDRDRKRSRRDETPTANDREREETPEARDRDRNRNRDRERRHRGDDRDGEQWRDRRWHAKDDEDPAEVASGNEITRMTREGVEVEADRLARAETGENIKNQEAKDYQSMNTPAPNLLDAFY